MEQPLVTVSPNEQEISSGLVARCWGTRGSIPSPGPATAAFGGNTPCLEVQFGADRRLIFDAGTGIRLLGQTLVNSDEHVEAIIFLTHFHWDHIQGFPFFAPLYDPEARLRIIGPKQFDVDVQTLFAGQMGPIYFPIPFEALAAKKYFSHLNDGSWEEHGAKVSAMRVKHPSITVGYRIDYESSSLAYVPDNELVGETYGVGENWRNELIDFLGDVDVLIHDAMFTDEEYDRRVGWGHSTYRQTVDLAHEAGAGKLLLFHHAPERSDVELVKITTQCREDAAAQGRTLEIEAAAEGDYFRI